ncbi:MAG: hypothetical protein PHS24_03785 [Bacilli bacterium]|nr:hypothetical protein [Bacilli bacterium]
MKRNGFTIIEIIISLVILVSIGLIIGVSLNKVFKNNEEAGLDSFKDQIISSTDLYLANNQSYINELQTTKGYLLIQVGELISAGLLDGNTIDPATGEKVASDNIVKVSLDANGLLKIEYNVDIPNESYLEAQNLNLEYKESFNCQDINSYTDEWGTQSLRLIDAEGNVYPANELSINDVITKIDCSIDTSKPGSSQIVYTYKIPDNEVLKSLSRTVIISSDPLDIITLSAVVEPKTVIINKNLTFTVTGTDRDGNQRVLNATDYIIDKHSTSAVGTFSPKITYNKDNSDGSKPTTTATYTVIYDPNDIVSLSATASPKKAIINGTVTFNVVGTKRSGATTTLTTNDYTVTQNSTATIGIKNPTFTYNKPNSDGSKPTTTTTYEVINTLSEIIDFDSDCIKQSDGSCWYIGLEEGNYLTYLGTTWRIYKKDSSNAIYLILNNTTGVSYVFAHERSGQECGIKRCCNAGYYDLDPIYTNKLNQDPNGLLTYLNNYLYLLSGNKAYLKSNEFDISEYNSTGVKMTNSIGLLSYSEYKKIASCNAFSCGSSYLNNGKIWGLGTPYGYDTLAVNYANITVGYRTVETITKNVNTIIYTSISEGTYLGVRPVIVLNTNVKIQGGDGTINNPFRVV